MLTNLLIEVNKKIYNYYRLILMDNDTFMRKLHFEAAMDLLLSYPALQMCWTVTNAKRYDQRLRPNEEGMKRMLNEDSAYRKPIVEDERAFNDGINYECLPIKGLYFIGETHFNPFTREEYYWVKVGKAVNFINRMKSYNTHNPMLWRIDYCTEYENEKYYQDRLAEICIATCNHNNEWFLVDRNTYLEMCEKGFSYFD